MTEDSRIMPAPRLTAAQLGLSQEVYDALIWVRDALDPEIPDKDLPAWIVFDMNSWDELGVGDEFSTSCRTALCIVGSMQMKMAGLERVPLESEMESREADAWRAASDRLHARQFPLSLGSLFFNYAGAAVNRGNSAAAIDLVLSGYKGNPWDRFRPQPGASA